MSDYYSESFKNAVRVDTLRERVAQLEAENAELREQLADLQCELRDAGASAIRDRENGSR
jgi:chaperonin cofactor prefoldin